MAKRWALLAALWFALIGCSTGAQAYGSVAVVQATSYQCSTGTSYISYGSGATPGAACQALPPQIESSVQIGGYSYQRVSTVTSVNGAPLCGSGCSFNFSRVYTALDGGPARASDTLNSVVARTRAVNSTCPDGATGSPNPNPTSCTCNAGYKPNAGATACIPDCTAQLRVSTGYFDVGTDPTKTPPLVGCVGNCRATYAGYSADKSEMVGGVKHWYARASYYATGDACTPAEAAGGLGQVPQGVDAIPAATCGANQGVAEMNGKKVCVDTANPSKPTDESISKATKSTEKSTVTNADGSSTTTETTTEIDASGNKKVTVTTTTNKPDGSSSSSTTETNTGKGTTPGEDSEDDSEAGKCEKNPSDAGCGGSAANIGNVYAAKGKTFSSVLSARVDQMKASAVGSAVAGFFTVNSGGTCPTFQASIAYLKTTLTIDQYCSAWATAALAILRMAMLVVCSFFAFRVAME